MSGTTAVTDANTIIGLAKGGVFDLLTSLFAAVYVPPQVVVEIVVKGQGRPGAKELTQALGKWAIEKAAVPSAIQQFAPSLSEADRAVLALAQAAGASCILTDDRDLRREAGRHHLLTAMLGWSCRVTCDAASQIHLLLAPGASDRRIRAAEAIIRASAAEPLVLDPGDMRPENALP